MSLRIRPLSYSLGAEIIGIDIRHPVDDKTISDIRRAFLEYGILLFRGPPLTREQHIAFSRRFGELDDNDTWLRLRHVEYPEILLVVHEPTPNAEPTDTGGYPGNDWHSDRSYTCVPSMASLMRGVKLPALGGDTMFTNMYRAYETLSDGMKKLIDGLYGVHIGGSQRFDRSTPEGAAQAKRLNPPVAQPLVRVHPETGRKALYVGYKVKQLIGLGPEESRLLLQFLCNHATRPQLCYRHEWRDGDLMMWDNRCTMHVALGDFDRTQLRHMERTTVRGTPSGYVYDGPLL